MCFLIINDWSLAVGEGVCSFQQYGLGDAAPAPECLDKPFMVCPALTKPDIPLVAIEWIFYGLEIELLADGENVLNL